MERKTHEHGWKNCMRTAAGFSPGSKTAKWGAPRTSARFQTRDLRERFLGLPEVGIGSLVFEHREHAGRQVIQNMAVKRPDARIIRIEMHLDR
jgi:hypothetical protein